MKAVAFLVLFLLVSHHVRAQVPVFDVHVHLREGGKSIDEYEARVDAAKGELIGFGGMWFGGPHQAAQGDLQRIRAQNDASIALAKKHPTLLPIATIHPYDGQAALDELKRVANLGVKVLKLHPHTQKFDVNDPRVLSLVQQAGTLDVAVLMDNVYFDISAIVVLAADSPIEAEFVWTLRNVGADRVLLGSDYPQFSLTQTLDALDTLDLDQDETPRFDTSTHGSCSLGDA